MGLSILIVVGLLFLALAIYIWNRGSLPSNIDELIKEVQSEELPEFVQGKTGIARNNGVSIFYETRGEDNTGDKTILLVMGHSNSLLGWPRHFVDPLVEAGYRVIRYDNRGTGLTDWISDWSRDNAYLLADMASDVISIMDTIEIKKVHVVGVSMGGMISQQMAITYPDRIHSLTSIMSTGYFNDPKLVNVPMPFYLGMVGVIIRHGWNLVQEEKKLKLQIAIRQLLAGSNNPPFDYKESLRKSMYEIRNRKGHNPKVKDQHSYAITKSGSRYDQLSKISAPTLVIHGENDPLIKVSHSKKYVQMIPGAEALFIKEMGHDLPQNFAPIIINGIINKIESISEKTVKRV